MGDARARGPRRPITRSGYGRFGAGRPVHERDPRRDRHRITRGRHVGESDRLAYIAEEFHHDNLRDYRDTNPASTRSARSSALLATGWRFSAAEAATSSCVRPHSHDHPATAPPGSDGHAATLDLTDRWLRSRRQEGPPPAISSDYADDLADLLGYDLSHWSAAKE